MWLHPIALLTQNLSLTASIANIIQRLISLFFFLSMFQLPPSANAVVKSLSFSNVKIAHIINIIFMKCYFAGSQWIYFSFNRIGRRNIDQHSNTNINQNINSFWCSHAAYLWNLAKFVNLDLLTKYNLMV